MIDDKKQRRDKSEKEKDIITIAIKFAMCLIFTECCQVQTYK